MVLLLYGLLKDYKSITFLAVSLITIDSLWNLNFSKDDLTLHVAIDLMAIGFISTGFLLIKKRLIKFAWMGLGLLSFIGLHIQIHTADLYEDIESSPDILLQFRNKKDLEFWVHNNDENYKLTYPLFQPLDNSFLLDEYVGLSVSSSERLLEVKQSLGKIPLIAHVEINDEVSLADKLLNDPRLDKQWTSDQHELNKFHKLLADRQAGIASSGSIIAILDTGIDADHEDLVANYTSMSRRYDNDVKGHGTHCAGIAAAVSGNGIGIASFLPPNSETKVTSIKVLNNFGMGSQKTIIDGIIKAADNGCDVISLSLGGISSDSKEKAYNEAVSYARDKGSIVVVAAGNSGGDARRYSPANSEGVIAVTATDTLNRKAAFGNDVSNIQMGLGAPGTQIYSTFPEDEYKTFDGSSMSAPFVSGLIGLMRSYNKDLSTEQAYEILKLSGDKNGDLFIVNPLAALKLFFEDYL